MTIITAIEKVLTKLIIGLAVGFFIAGTLLYIFQIASRLLFQDSFFWIDALISYLFTLAALMGAVLAVRDRENIKIDILRRYAQKPGFLLITDSFSFLVTVLLLGIFSAHTGELFSSTSQSVFGVSKWILNIPYLVLLLGSLVYYIQLVITDFRNWQEPSKDIL